jgi:HTH-type transcriptional regulator/antitoxin HigA
MPRPATRRPPAPDRYLDLVRQFPLRPIRTEAGLDAAIAMIDALSDRGDLTAEEQDYLLVLADLVERYEAEIHPMPPVSGAEMLRHLIDAKDVTQREVAAETGVSGPIISEILSGKRPLNLRHVEAFARYFRVSPAVFIAD